MRNGWTYPADYFVDPVVPTHQPTNSPTHYFSLDRWKRLKWRKRSKKCLSKFPKYPDSKAHDYSLTKSTSLSFCTHQVNSRSKEDSSQIYTASVILSKAKNPGKEKHGSFVALRMTGLSPLSFTNHESRVTNVCLLEMMTRFSRDRYSSLVSRHSSLYPWVRYHPWEVQSYFMTDRYSDISRIRKCEKILRSKKMWNYMTDTPSSILSTML